MIADLKERMDAAIQKEGQVRPVHCLSASNIGHPCERYLFYLRSRWQDQIPPDAGLMRVFRLGNMFEKIGRQYVEDAGLEVEESQRAFAVNGRDGKPLVTGHIDGMIRDPSNGTDRYPIEIKSMSPNIWPSIGNVEDMTRSTKPWVRQYPAQLQMYLLGTECEEGLYLLINKTTGEPKPVWTSLDMEYAEGLLQKAERVEAAVKAEEPPDRIEDDGQCSRCPFRAICLPDRDFGNGLEVLDDTELESKLERRAELSAAVSEFNQVDSEIKATAKAKGEGQISCGRFLLSTKKGQRTYKAQDARTIETVTTKITAIS